MTKNIILLSNAYLPSIGGVENSLRHLAKEAQESGDTVKIIVSDIAVPMDAPDRFSSIIDNISVIRYPISPIKFKPFKWLNLLFSSLVLYRILRKEYLHHPEATIISRFHMCSLVALFAGFRNVRYLVPSVIVNQSGIEISRTSSIYDQIRQNMFIMVHNYLQREALRQCKNFVFSETMRHQCIKLAGNESVNYCLTKPGVDSNRFCPASENERIELKSRLNLPKDKPLLLFVGRFVKAKGVDLLIEAMQFVRDDCYLLLVGSGNEIKHYKELIARHDLNNCIYIREPTRNVEDFYRSADIFVMSSRYEPFGQTLLEAFSSGLMVIAFKKTAGVDTATEEIGMNDHIIFSDRLDSRSLSKAIKFGLRSIDKVDRFLISKISSGMFSWRKLYIELSNHY